MHFGFWILDFGLRPILTTNHYSYFLDAK
jgi:hypothetical protein